MLTSNQLLKVILVILPISESLADETLASQSLSELLGTVNSLSAEFIQTLSDANGNIFETSYGSFSIAQPNKVRWVVTKPMPQQIISNGEILWIFDPDLEQVVIQPYDSDVLVSPASLFSANSQQLSDDFDISYKPSDSVSDSYYLLPKSSSALYQSLRIDFQNRKPVSFEFIDAMQQSTRIDLGDVIVNPPLADGLFVFEVPAEIDVINHVK